MIPKQHVPTFLLSAASDRQYPVPDKPEVALAGRSNVGKSSFINALFNRKALARTSSKPGKTQQLNYFSVDDAWYFVDMPGYGYAKISKSERERWRRQMEAYFADRENLMLVLVLVDFRHQPSKDDIAMIDQLNTEEMPYFIIATKADKVKRNQHDKQLHLIKDTLDLVSVDQILPVSSKERQGLDEAWEIISAVLNEEFVE
ncbi:MAG: ribosome biogenesis GTP-binding protein YihA/YsxC [Aerococcus sp.]|nr:ribosome biogenesis GTP-binding protein YihA/YsxC [Aerococcus sp.]